MLCGIPGKGAIYAVFFSVIPDHRGLGFGRLRFYLIQVDCLINLIYPIII